MIVAAAAAAVVLGVVGVGVGVGVGIAAAAVAVVVEVEVAAAVEIVIDRTFILAFICCGVTGFEYGSGMERVWIGVWIGTRYLGRLSRCGCEGKERGISSLV